jgi:hypothetical protein
MNPSVCVIRQCRQVLPACRAQIEERRLLLVKYSSGNTPDMDFGYACF